jgi:GNAT superfamily N-acetyltransferase
MAALETWGREVGASRCYLQVEAANTGALALYRQRGFTEHHRTHYRTAPS